MRPRRCTIDSSCIIALDHLRLVPKLSMLFSLVLVPKSVRHELFRRRATKDRLQSIFSDFGFFRGVMAMTRAPLTFFSRNGLDSGRRIGKRSRPSCKLRNSALLSSSMMPGGGIWPAATIWNSTVRSGFFISSTSSACFHQRCETASRYCAIGVCAFLGMLSTSCW